jgi:predicted small metal-binding protein
VADDPGTRPDVSTDNPSINPKTEAVNRSAPTAGTEGWGNTEDERRTLSENPPSISKDGQIPHAEGSNQVEPSWRWGSPAICMNVTHEGRDRTFRCADVGNADCRWETSGASDEEILGEVHRHGQTEHGLNDWTDAMRNRIRDAIRERHAA